VDVVTVKATRGVGVPAAMVAMVVLLVMLVVAMVLVLVVVLVMVVLVVVTAAVVTVTVAAVVAGAPLALATATTAPTLMVRWGHGTAFATVWGLVGSTFASPTKFPLAFALRSWMGVRTGRWLRTPVALMRPRRPLCWGRCTPYTVGETEAPPWTTDC
jgi:hypothetical protein